MLPQRTLSLDTRNGLYSVTSIKVEGILLKTKVLRGKSQKNMEI